MPGRAVAHQQRAGPHQLAQAALVPWRSGLADGEERDAARCAERARNPVANESERGAAEGRESWPPHSLPIAQETHHADTHTHIDYQSRRMRKVCIQRCMHPENHARLSMRTCIHMPGICERPVTRCANEIAVTPYMHHPACDACMCAPTTQRTFGEGTQSSGYRR